MRTRSGTSTIAAPYLGGQATAAGYLARGTSAAEAAEARVDVLRGIVERDDPWPEEG